MLIGSKIFWFDGTIDYARDELPCRNRKRNKRMDSVEKRIKNINNKLESAGSIFRTKDGLTIVGHIGHLTFLKRTYGSIEELEEASDNAVRYSKGRTTPAVKAGV